MFFRKENINLNQRIGSTIPLSGQPGNFDFMIYVTCYPYKVVRDKECHQQTNTHHEKSVRCAQPTGYYISSVGKMTFELNKLRLGIWFSLTPHRSL